MEFSDPVEHIASLLTDNGYDRNDGNSAWFELSGQQRRSALGISPIIARSAHISLRASLYRCRGQGYLPRPGDVAAVADGSQLTSLSPAIEWLEERRQG